MIQDFKKWWETNKSLYEDLGIKKEHAETIWNAAVDNFVTYVQYKLLTGKIYEL